jgi:ribosomal protein S12 methylthiotransferase accessory factor YcaO
MEGSVIGLELRLGEADNVQDSVNAVFLDGGDGRQVPKPAIVLQRSTVVDVDDAILPQVNGCGQGSGSGGGVAGS